MKALRSLVAFALVALAAASPAEARGNGGWNTKNYRLSQPATTTWYCALSLASGECGPGPFADYGNMTCDGLTDDRPAKDALVTTIASHNPLPAAVYLPPGHYCRFFAGSGLNYAGDNVPFTGITANNISWWGYGSKIDYMQIGGSALYQDNITHSSTINTVSAGATTLVVNDGGEAQYSAGDSIMVAGVNGPFGFPPTFQYYEEQIVTARSGATITVSQPLENSYKQTWPAFSLSGNVGIGGPGAIFRHPPTWNSNVQVFGITFNPEGFVYQPNAVSKNVALYDVTVGPPSTLAPSSNKTAFMFRTNVFQGMEIDKQIELLYIYRSNIGLSGVQSPSPKKMIVDTSNIYCAVGTAVDTEFRNTVNHAAGCTGEITLGPIGSGTGQTILLDNASFPAAGGFQIEIPVSETSFSAGSIRVAKASDFTNYLRAFQIGAHLKFAWHNAGLGACSPTTTFTVTDLREDATYYYADTDIVGALPTPDCHGNLIPNYTQYPATSIRQINSPAGSPDARPYVAPP